jgi:hypothetical protein
MTTDEQQQDTTTPTPLELARAWAARVYAIAAHYEQAEADEPGFGMLQAHVHGAGKQQFEAAQMAGYMATVSIAEDLHGLRELLGGLLDALLSEDANPPGDPLSEEGKAGAS